MKKIKITVLATTFNAEIAKEYAAEGLTPCTYNTVGQIFYSDGWLKDKNTAIISCNDGTRPVVYKIEALDEGAGG